MKEFIKKAHPVLSVLVDVLIVYELGKELITDIMKYRSKNKETSQQSFA